jgi:hypothetical protein
MRYCEDCGNGHDCTAEGRETPESDEVKIARINREADVKIAQLAARSAREELETTEAVAEIQADAEIEAAVAEAEVVGAAIEAGIEPEPEPVIIDAPTAINEEPEDAPPPAEGSEPPAPKRRSVGLGAW